jgi:hypothetical protein
MSIPSNGLVIRIPLDLEGDVHELRAVSADAETSVIGHRELGELLDDFLVTEQSVRTLDGETEEG